MSDTTTPTTPSPAPPDRNARWREVGREIVAGNAMVSFLALLLAVVVGSLLIGLTSADVRDSFGSSDFLSKFWETITGAYDSLFKGAIWNADGKNFDFQIRPLTETLKFAGPLIAAGLGVGLAFRAGMFNIGGRGQMIMAGAFAGWIGFKLDLPTIIHLPLAIIVGMVAGALWAGLAGLIKARTGAHEVILTIMLNYIAYYLVFFALTKKNLLQAPGSDNPKSLPMKDSATLPKIAGDHFNLHLGFVLALVGVAVTWWILNRSALGYQMRAVGLNPTAAQAAGINVGRIYVVTMTIAGALIGLAGVNQVLGTVPSGVGTDVDAGIGFDAITVALLGRSRPLGILAAGLLFGAFKAGGFAMQASQGISVDIVLVVQSLIVLFIAAPPLVRAIFRLPKESK
ncbi:MAG: ABC transporter permease [Nocardioides sp.]|uniref:ABC transporter permease n=1 Tax=Nocardioides sp. TaxID=35761 RepID=UPI0039E48613